MTAVKTKWLRQFYLQRLKPIRLIRVIKNTVWKLIWYMRWKVVRPVKNVILKLVWQSRWKVVQPIKNVILTSVWQMRWKVARPIAHVIFPRRMLNRLYTYSKGGSKLFVRRWFTPMLLLAPLKIEIDLSGVDTIALTDRELNQPIVKSVTCISDSEAVCAASPAIYCSSDVSQLIIPKQNYSFPKIEIIQILNAEIIGRSNLIMANGVMLHHALYKFSHDFTSEELHGRIIIYPRTSTVRRIAISESKYTFDTAAVFTDACSLNYAHWLTEVLPRINIFCRTNKVSDVVLIIDFGLHPNIEASLSAVVGCNVRVQRINVNEVVKVNTLCVVSPTSYIPFDRRPGVKIGHRHGVFSPYALAFLRSHLDSTFAKNSKTALPRKIFVRRNSHSRLILNERELETSLVARGFEVIEPERLSFSEQFHLFSSASIIVGATGAALANLIFCSKDTRIVVCLSAHPDHSFGYWQNMAAASGNQVVYVLGPLVSSNAQGVHANFSINVNDVLKAIEN